jgi:hypothetical protein
MVLLSVSVNKAYTSLFMDIRKFSALENFLRMRYNDGDNGLTGARRPCQPTEGKTALWHRRIGRC